MGETKTVLRPVGELERIDVLRAVAAVSMGQRGIPTADLA